MSNPIVLASNNIGKLREIQHLLGKSSIQIIPQSEFNVPDTQENALTFIENAILKARCAARYSGLPAIADDSGLEVDALNGAPGIYSARFAGKNATDQENREKLLYELKDIPEEHRTARFQCVIVYLRHFKDPTPIIVQGTWQGRILFHEQGKNGFGYDPLFFVPTHNCSAAELPIDIKNQISHRGQALNRLIEYINSSL